MGRVVSYVRAGMCRQRRDNSVGNLSVCGRETVWSYHRREVGRDQIVSRTDSFRFGSRIRTTGQFTQCDQNVPDLAPIRPAFVRKRGSNKVQWHPCARWCRRQDGQKIVDRLVAHVHSRHADRRRENSLKSLLVRERLNVACTP